MQACFWISTVVLFYTYIGYGMMLLLINLMRKRRKVSAPVDYPAVTFVVPAYNERSVIQKKIENTLSLQYPHNRLRIVVITDGSTDGTDELVRTYPEVDLLHEPARRGKAAALNRVMQVVDTPVVVFSDANTFLHPESIRKMVRHYSDPHVGGISGEKRVANTESSAVGFGERLYWRYESLLKKANADFYTILGAAGELFSIRTHLYKPLEESVILDDFVISARVCLQGYRFLYEAEAYGIESSSTSIDEERKRKVRISAGCYQALFLLKGLLNPFWNLRIAFQYVSHRVLRWTVCPLLLPLLLICNSLLFFQHAGPLYTAAFACQVGFYVAALFGWLLVGRKKDIPAFFLVPYYFLFMVFSQYAGFLRFLRKKQSVLWEKARREPAVPTR